MPSARGHLRQVLQRLELLRAQHRQVASAAADALLAGARRRRTVVRESLGRPSAAQPASLLAELRPGRARGNRLGAVWPDLAHELGSAGCRQQRDRRHRPDGRVRVPEERGWTCLRRFAGQVIITNDSRASDTARVS